MFNLYFSPLLQMHVNIQPASLHLEFPAPCCHLSMSTTWTPVLPFSPTLQPPKLVKYCLDVPIGPFPLFSFHRLLLDYCPPPSYSLFPSWSTRQAASQLFSHICSAAPQLKTLSQCLTVFGLGPSPWTPQRVWLGLVTCLIRRRPFHTTPSNTLSTHSRCTCCPGPLLALVQTTMHFCLGSPPLKSPLWTPTGCQVRPTRPALITRLKFACD